MGATTILRDQDEKIAPQRGSLEKRKRPKAAFSRPHRSMQSHAKIVLGKKTAVATGFEY
jgi:hypothetical protein